MKLTFTVPNLEESLRLDKYLGLHDEIGSRSRAQLLLELGAVKVNGLLASRGSMLLAGTETIEVELPEPEPVELQPLPLPLKILFEDPYLIVLHKPPGLVVHPAAGHSQDTLVNALVAHEPQFAMKFGENRPGIVHRLDKDTSGIMVVAKTDQVQEALSLQFRERTIHRYYRAIAVGTLMPMQGSFQSYLARHQRDRKKYASIRDLRGKIIQDRLQSPSVGKWAHTDYQVLSRHPSGLTYLKLKLHTGRTHQIRVHLSERGYPILGDELYGGVRKSHPVPRLALHAAELGFAHPITGENYFFEEPWPEDYRELVQRLFESK